jgi:DeoR/GlpR family transcriptional regulator of sugar metabolism
MFAKKSMDERRADITAMLNIKPMSVEELSQSFSCAPNTIRAVFKTMNIKIVDYRMSGATARNYTPLYSTKGRAITIEKWCEKNNVQEDRNKRKRARDKVYRENRKENLQKLAAKNLQPEALVKGIPISVVKRFNHGASVVCFEGRVYKRDLFSC